MAKYDNKQQAAADFAQRWAGRGYEKGDSQIFWIELLTSVLGVKTPSEVISFEDQVHLDHTSFIDAYIAATHVMIEQKSISKDLRAPIKQSDGTMLNPFQQAKRYATELPYSQRPRWIVTCNFRSFLIYDMEQPQGEPAEILLENLDKEYHRLLFLVDRQAKTITRQEQISIEAGRLIGRIYDLLQAQYLDPNSPETLRFLNILCVRLVFCLYAEDAGVFPEVQMFGNYLRRHHKESNIRKALKELFEVFNTPVEQRDPYMDDDLKAFPYVSGGLFADTNVVIPNFTDELTTLLIERTSEGVDWSDISPTIFGAVFESTLNPETRRTGGMHYTSVENIHKVIDPLFMDDLWSEFHTINNGPMDKKRAARLDAFQDRLASLHFLDPACGSGNFLTETYLSLRRLENEVIKSRLGGQMIMGDIIDPIKVKIDQFYGIEINDFAVTVAQTALWIAEAQMMKETERIVRKNIDFLPLRSYAHVVEGNALRIDWNTVCPADQLHYIMGNPPFVGASYCSASQKEEIVNLFGNIKLSNSLDYVSGWYYKASQFIKNTNIQTAFVSTNSITQGEQVAPIWRTLKAKFNIKINFAWRTFRWDSESSDKAHVHCVIIGFAYSEKPIKTIYTENENRITCKNINGYLADAPDVFLDSRAVPISSVPIMTHGSKPSDGGYLILSEIEKNELLLKFPEAYKFIKQYSGGVDFLRNQKRYCLWLVDASPKDINDIPPIKERVIKVRETRLLSTSKTTKQKADFPTLFFTNLQPKSGMMLVGPQVSSGKRKYVPFGFYNSDIIASDKLLILPQANKFIFGVMSSVVHNAWIRLVAGRLKSDFTYSVNIVYNNFPWPTPTEEQKTKIEQTAQAILDARALYPDSSLADLYDEVTMPPELRKAHQQNDRAVMAAYGFPKDLSESDIVARLLELYSELTK